ncbi:MAG: hypothetical protein AB9919_06105 [Geobacteraceae bacterium]|jgi:hypothetical protein
MKYISILFGVALIAGFVISGCASNRELIVNSSHATRNDVFSEISSSETESGKAIVQCRSGLGVLIAAQATPT